MSNDRLHPNQHGHSFDDITRRDIMLGSTALLTATALSGIALPGPANAQVPKPGVDPTPGFNNKIPRRF
jgi:hypothetical protein